MYRQSIIWLLLFVAVLASCSPFPRESERMAEAWVFKNPTSHVGGIFLHKYWTDAIQIINMGNFI